MWPNPRKPTEAQWSPDDVAEVISWRAYEGGRCGRCGTHPDEWPTDERDDPAYMAEQIRCWGCQAVDEESAELPDGSDRHGVHVVLRPFSVDAFEDIELERIRRQEARGLGPEEPSGGGPI